MGGIETQQAGRAGGHRKGQRRGVVEAGAHGGQLLQQPALHLVGNGQGQQQVFAAAVGVVGHGQQAAEVVGRVAHFALAGVVVHEIEVAHQRRIIQRRPVDGCAAATRQRAVRVAAQLLYQRQNLPRGLAVDGPNQATQRIQNVVLEALPYFSGKVGRRNAEGERGNLLGSGHGGFHAFRF